MASISIRRLTKHYGATPVLHALDLDIHDGEFLALVGPSGCGKSTLLRTIAGLDSASAGEIRLGERAIHEAPPRERDIAMVFQNYALYPHMTVRANLGFALNLQGIAPAEVERRVNDAAALLGLSALLGRKPRQLSGGQRQRVAMGRAIVRRPQAFLFDEPLSNLDAQLRVQMRTEIKALHQRLRTTTVYVTHDQIEAMTMADRIAVLRDGAIEQIGTPLALYDRPANAFVAAFIGSPSMNLIPGRLHLDGAACVVTHDGLRLPLAQAPSGAAPDARVLYGARPEHFVLDAAHGASAEVRVVEPTGAQTQIVARLAGQDVLAAFRDRHAPRPGERLALWPRAEHAHVFDAASGLRLG